jgi:mono/diheme cytochrome c family protein
MRLARSSGGWFACLCLALACIAAPDGPGAAQDGGPASAGRRLYEKANCIGCHKWHGGGGGGYGGAALSLRQTPLDLEQIVEVVRCGRPGTGMPYHDREAYRDDRCYGLTQQQVGKDMPPRARSFLDAGEIEAVAAYVAAAIKGKGPPTQEDCVAFWGAASRECQAASR